MSRGTSFAAEPWRVCFPIGLLCLWAGASHWVIFALGWSSDGSSVFHGIAQTQGFVLAFALGFLLTMIPAHTATAPASRLLLVIGAVGTFGTIVAVHQGAVSQGESAFVVLAVAMLAFAVTRLRRAARSAPAGLIWFAHAFSIALFGAVFTGIGGALGREFFAWHEFGKLCVTQGTVLALMLGAGTVAVPELEGAAPPLGATRRSTSLSGIAAAALVGTFAVEVLLDYRVGHTVRGLLLLGVSARPLRLLAPLPRGVDAITVRLACWAVPLGLLAGAFSAWPRLGLHVAYAGGVAPFVLVVAAHVARAPAGALAWATALSCAAAMCLRAAAEIDPLHRTRWLGFAAAALLVASCAWAARVLPRCRRVSANRPGLRGLG
ncbi:MAG: NnrS family protein [Planctomycetes bacterium]|nr:NnrS family protein [Planctomycetota bacterium]